jgi:hypothetical protein
VKIFTEAHKSRRKRGESMESIPSSSITNNRKYSIPGLSQTEREWGTGGEKIFKII